MAEYPVTTAIANGDPDIPILPGEGGVDSNFDGILDTRADLDGDGALFEDLLFAEAPIGADLDGDGAMTSVFTTTGDLPFDGSGEAPAADGAGGSGLPDAGALEAQLVAPEPAGIVVTTLDDVVAGMDMQTSLREAIAEANARPGIDLITFAPGLAGGTIRLTQGALVSTDSLIVTGDIDQDGTPDITITGDVRDNDVTSPGSDITEVQATLAVPVEDNGIDDDGDGTTDEAGEDLLDDNVRIFEFPNETAETTLDGLVLTGGRTLDDLGEGGAVSGSGQLTLTNMLVAGNSTAGEYARGGAVFTDGVVNVLDSTFSGNETGQREAGGGAIAAEIVSATDSLFVSNATRGGNSDGGAIAANGFLVLSDTELSGNATQGLSSDGGAAYARDGIFASDSVISGNMTEGPRSAGGGLAVNPNRDVGIVLTGTTVHANSTRGPAAEGGGLVTGRLSAVDTTISDNFTLGDADGSGNSAGGGFFAEDAFLLNVTVAGNFTAGSGEAAALEQAGSALIGGPYGHGAPGGGGYVEQRIEAIHSTFTGNSVSGAGQPLQFRTVSADVQAAAAPGEFGGGAIQLAPVTGATAIFTNSIVLGSLVSTGTIAICIDELAGPAGAFHFRGQNIVGPDPDAFDPSSANPMIGSGADNVINANPNIVYEQIAPVGTDTDGDGVKDTFSETVNRGVLADNEGQVQTVALLPGEQGPQRPALDSADRAQAINLDEGVYLTDFNADGDTLDVFPTLAELRFDARQDYFSRDIDTPEGIENSPDLGAFELQRPPEFAIAAVDAVQQEGDSGAVEYIFEITRTVRLDGPVSVDFAVTGSGASPATAADFLFDALPTGTVEFEDLQETATITVLGETDTDPEPDEGFTVTLTGVDGDPYGAGVPGLITGPTAGGTILNDDALPPPSEVSIAAVEPALPEGDTGITFFPFLITRTGDTSTPMTVDLSGAGSGPDPADQDDFTGDAFGTVSLQPGVETFAVIVSVNGDTEVEPDEDFTLTLSNLVGNGVLAETEATGTILNDDVATGTPTVSIAPVSTDLAEGDTGTTPFVFLVSRTGETGVPASVDYAAIPQTGDGADPGDFAQGTLPSGSVSFAAGETTKLLVLDVAGDTQIETDEGFAVTLSNPGGGAQIGTASAPATIRNDDADMADLPPVTEDDYVATPLDTAVAIEVLADDIDPEGGPLALGDLETDPAFGGMAENGTVSVGQGTEVIYTPDPGFNGIDRFSYEAVDAAGNATSGEVVVQVGPTPPFDPAETGSLVRGGAGDDVITPGPKGTYLGQGGDDTLLISQAVQAGQGIVFDDSGNTTVQIADGTQIVSSIVAQTGDAIAVALTLRNGAQVRVLSADEHVYEIGGNATTGQEGTELAYEAFVTQVLGTTVPGDGELTMGGFVEIGAVTAQPELVDLAPEEAPRPAVAEPDAMLFAGEVEADAFVWG